MSGFVQNPRMFSSLDRNSWFQLGLVNHLSLVLLKDSQGFGALFSDAKAELMIIFIE